jgi:hypothetical protein
MNDNWNTGDTAIAICNIYLFIQDKSGKELEKKLITKGRDYLVKDVQTIKCIDTLEVRISRYFSF